MSSAQATLNIDCPPSAHIYATLADRLGVRLCFRGLGRTFHSFDRGWEVVFEEANRSVHGARRLSFRHRLVSGASCAGPLNVGTDVTPSVTWSHGVAGRGHRTLRNSTPQRSGR